MNNRGNSLGWVVAGALLIVLVASFELGSSTASAHKPLRSEHAHPANSAIPAGMMVVVSKDGKTFHAADCRYIHDPARKQTMAAGEAVREGYVPCIRCLAKYAR
jgi:hypothetical protein